MLATTMHSGHDLIELTARIVASFVSNNTVRIADLPQLINVTHGALVGLSPIQADPAMQRVPAVPANQSVTPDYIVCLDDGCQLKTLKRHIRRKHSLSPDEYRARWNLPNDYPMVAPSYSNLRSSIAKRKTARVGESNRSPIAENSPYKRE
jgi:predicted transcriptional regulator